MIGDLLAARYELVGPIAEGPIFSTYSARDRATGRDVAIRIVHDSFTADEVFAVNLKRAVTKFGNLRGPQLEAIQDVVLDEGTLFLVSDLTRTPSLADRIRKLAPFSIPVSVGTGISICQALENIHANGLAHGDLTPQNVAVLANGEVRLQLTGLSEAYTNHPDVEQALAEGIAPYLAPEVAAGALPTPSSDVYAVGVMLFELLSGRTPYQADSERTISPSVKEINPSVPSVLNEIIRKAMAFDVMDRYADGRHLLHDLRKLQDALRFGRAISWPIEAPANAAVPEPPKKKATAPSPKPVPEVSQRPQPVAPRMSAIRTDEEYERPAKRKKVERDVPLWMTMLIVFLGAVVISLVGVWMLLNINRPQLITVPNVINMSEPEARAVLADSGLDLSVRARLIDEKVELGKILEVNPKAGEKVRQGGRVSATVSAGSRYVTMPDLKGMTVDKAKTILSSLNLEMDTNIIKINDATVEPGLILRTRPAAKSQVERQSQVTVIINSGTEGQDLPLPDEDGYLYTLNLRLDRLRDNARVRIDMTDEKGKRTIYEEDHEPNDSFPVSVVGYGPEATFEIYYDDRLILTETRSASEGEAQ